MSSTDNSLREHYLSHIEKHKKTKLSIKEYCKQNDLIEHKFSYYRHYKLKSTQPQAKSFSKVKLTPPSVKKDNSKKTTTKPSIERL